MNQSTPVLRSKLPRFCLHLFLGSTSFFAYPFITFLTGQGVIASANTEIIVDPYNDSSSEPLTIDAPLGKITPSDNNNTLPTGNQNSTIGEVFVNGNAAPPRPTAVSGSLIKSNQPLPQIPPLSEPYRRPDVNNQINQNSADSRDANKKITTLSVSVSPFDQTPNDSQPTLSEEKTVNPSHNLKTTPRSINLSPNASPSVNNSPGNGRNTNAASPQPVAPKTNVGRRRSLNDILVFSAPPKNNSNNSIVTPTTPVNQASSLNTITNNIHKVLVKVNNSTQESQVRSLYPEAFRTNLRGVQMLQVGVFSNPEKAQEVSNSLKKMGLNVHITMNNQ